MFLLFTNVFHHIAIVGGNSNNNNDNNNDDDDNRPTYQHNSIEERRNAQIKCAKGIRRRSMNELGEYDMEKYERGKN